MYKAAMKPECCKDFDPLPRKLNCFLPEICEDLKCLMKRHKSSFDKSKRLHQLALPMHRMMAFTPRCPCPLAKQITIIRCEEPIYTRTEQLAYPQVRKLLLKKDKVQKMFPKERLEVLNRLIRHSLLSLYSRLQNIQPPEKRIPVKKWDEKEWKQHMRYIRKLAKSKIPPPQPKMPVARMPLKKMKRYKKLAKPKKRLDLLKIDWVFTPSMKQYKPTPRLIELAVPHARDEEALYQSLPIKVTAGALRYKASKRTLELATPPEKRTAEPEIRDDAFTISPNALKAKPSQRTQDLAEPREFENNHIRDNPNAISPAALKAKATPRLIELAKPKGS